MPQSHIEQSDFRTDPENKNRLITDTELANGRTQRVEINLVPDGTVVMLPGAPQYLRAAHVGLGKAGKLMRRAPHTVNKQNLLDDILEKSVKEANKLLDNLNSHNDDKSKKE